MLAAQLMALLVAAVATAAGNDEGLSLSRERETERTQQELTEQLLADQAERQPELRDPMSIGYYPSRRERPPSGSGPTSSPLPSTPGGGVSSSSSTAQLPSSSQATSSPSVQPVSSPQAPVVTETEEASLRLPGAGSTKPTKYHYYPHNQHIYLLPECAVQQVCNAVYVRLNYTQPLCACPSRYREPCSASLNSDDLHTTELSTQPSGKVLTLVKTCEPVADMRVCRSPRDWSLLALQNIRTGKSHYLVICRCPETSILEGPMSHDQPTYASVPGIRVYGMMCVSKGYRSGPSPTPTQGSKRRSRPLRSSRDLRFWDAVVPFPWHKVKTLIKSMDF